MSFQETYEWAYAYIPRIDAEKAGLLVQVFPVFIIAILLESRFTGSGFSAHPWVIMSVSFIRFCAVILPTGATFLCLQVFMLDHPNEPTDWLATFAAFASAVGFLAMCGDLLVRDWDNATGRGSGNARSD